MSAFHNSKGGELLALAWHKFGTFVSLATCLMNLVCSAWCSVMGFFMIFFLARPDGGMLFLFSAAGCALCSFIAFMGIFWHRQAEKDHAQHLKDLESAP